MKECFICLGSLVKNGLSKTKKQQFYCKPCKKSFTEGIPNKTKIKKEVFEKRNGNESLRKIAREYSVSPSTILNWFKKMNNFKNEIEFETSLNFSDLQNFLHNNYSSAEKGILIIENKIIAIDLKN